MTTDDLTALQALLAKMTPGEWIAAPYSSMVGAPIVASPSGRPVAKVTYFHLGPEFDNHNRESAANAAGIVALVNAAPALIASAARVAELEAEVAEWRKCMQFDALMSGPVFKGWDRSQMERCRKKHEARAALGAA